MNVAALSSRGAIMASPGKETAEDEYEEEGENEQERQEVDNKKFSHVFYKSFSTHGYQWTYRLQEGEKAQLVATGEGWAAVYTDFNNLRIFSEEGIQKSIFSTPLLLTMFGHKSQLCLVQMTGVPLKGN